MTQPETACDSTQGNMCVGDSCTVSTDCATNYCNLDTGMCESWEFPTCDNSTLGSYCAGAVCSLASDCYSGMCTDGTCDSLIDMDAVVAGMSAVLTIVMVLLIVVCLCIVGCIVCCCFCVAASAKGITEASQ